MYDNLPCRHSNLRKQKMKPSEQNAIDVADAHIKKHAIAYYRSSSERQSEHSISVQQAHIRAWAVKNGIKIIREFSDAGKSGSIDEERPAFDEMMEDLAKCSDFAYVLCVDASRLSRFQDDDLYIRLSDQCKRHNKPLIYTGAGKQFGDDPL